ncbi:universal stress protein [Streptomyces axinellae]|uniref:Universal stress protein n=1 Tax=Streptomyces axinellae TaxID=552788 RepID=A0ABN3PL34_9ACTN
MTKSAVTVGFDGSAESQAALEWAAFEAERRDLPLQLLHVWSWQPYALTADPDKEQEWVERVPRRAARRLAERHPGLRIDHRNVPGVPADVLSDPAPETTLLVLGSRALGRVGGYLLGSVGQEVLSRTEGPVVMVRAPFDEGEDQEGATPAQHPGDSPVAVGLDLVQPSEQVLRFAFETAALRGAALRAVYAWRVPPVFSYGPRMVDQRLRGDLERREREMLTKVLRPWRERHPGVTVEESVAPGNATRHLVASSHDASLLVVGRRVRHPALGPQLGPVTQAAVHHATPPVAVIPHG